MRLISRWFAVLILLSSASVFAQQPRVEFHGFGSWGYGNTDRNNYLIGTPEGDYGNVEFVLNATAVLNEQLSIHSQVEWNRRAETSTNLEYAFAEWKFSDAFRLR